MSLTDIYENRTCGELVRRGNRLYEIDAFGRMVPKIITRKGIAAKQRRAAKIKQLAAGGWV